MKNKVLGMVLGGAVGDALGLPVESWDAKRIKEKYPEGIRSYLPPDGHKYFDAEKTPAGTTTDDTQLTISTMFGMITAKHRNDVNYYDTLLHSIAQEHIEAAKVTQDGWGKTTREAVRRLNNGAHWSVAGQTKVAGRGTGNGVPMKCAPLAVLLAAGLVHDVREFYEFLINYSAMTHYTQMSALSTIVHVTAVDYCLKTNPQDFDIDAFTTALVNACESHLYDESRLDVNSNDELADRIRLLHFCGKDIPNMSSEEIADKFGNGCCYIYESVPVVYAHFIKDPFSLESIYNVIASGGDTDTNAKMVAELLGALNGIELFEKEDWMFSGLVGYRRFKDIAESFYNTHFES